MTDQVTHNRQSFKDQGAEFMKANVEESLYDYAANCPPHTFKLAGKALTLHLKDTPVRIQHVFKEKQVRWEITGGPKAGESQEVAYEAFELAKNIFFISFLTRDHKSFGITADLSRGAATVVQGIITPEGVVSRVHLARIDELADDAKNIYHMPYSLGGTRFLNTYADNVAYEHIYLTPVYEPGWALKAPSKARQILKSTIPLR